MTQQLRPETREFDAEPAEARRSAIDRYFRITARGSTVSRELRGGLTTFVAMSYIVLLNPLILGSSSDATGATLSTTALTTSTALCAGLLTILMGVVGNAPLSMAAGLGAIPIVAFTIAPEMTWAQAFGLVVLEGICIILMAISGVRERIINAIPLPLKTALTVGIGLYIALVGLVSAGFVTRVPDAADTTVPVQMGDSGSMGGWPITLFCLTLLLMVVLVARKVPGAILISIATGTVLSIIVNSAFDIPEGAWGRTAPELPSSLVSIPDFSLLGTIDLFGGFVSAGAVAGTVFLFTLVLSGFFDAMGTITSVGNEAGLMNSRGKIRGMGRILLVDGVGAASGGLAGSAPNTVFLESAAGVGEGARTGLASVVTGALFAATMLFTPLAAVVPAQAAAPALVVVGGMMMAQCANIPWNDGDYVIPVFLTVAIIPFTYSITNGVGAGLIAYCAIKVCKGRLREIGGIMGVLAVVFALYFGIEGVKTLFGAG
ncbi:AGZA family xanthine/uracil permease-like MFS transporter [Halopolyspora algeriensis]|uniref:AGZA family xanthine/uracil permease-like MFS transporter n=1 Tax=Halopolyspora algeriensis TaxID=1500506 RepID=A0A368VN66_9ACTN|nr:NCS2 family permease [Halopolyspora algeriensis]RCW42924.1 AGZA family xanthine/uracil permease-like MFS transporter [Halopolyspora algeriensis]TQM56607.1 AGZA family xanthine/uracil permease-like MFS transporter [Halopolyspora algeriensis]